MLSDPPGPVLDRRESHAPQCIGRRIACPSRNAQDSGRLQSRALHSVVLASRARKPSSVHRGNPLKTGGLCLPLARTELRNPPARTREGCKVMPKRGRLTHASRSPILVKLTPSPLTNWPDSSITPPRRMRRAPLPRKGRGGRTCGRCETPSHRPKPGPGTSAGCGLKVVHPIRPRGRRFGLGRSGEGDTRCGPIRRLARLSSGSRLREPGPAAFHPARPPRRSVGGRFARGGSRDRRLPDRRGRAGYLRLAF